MLVHSQGSWGRAWGLGPLDQGAGLRGQVPAAGSAACCLRQCLSTVCADVPQADTAVWLSNVGHSQLGASKSKNTPTIPQKHAPCVHGAEVGLAGLRRARHAPRAEPLAAGHVPVPGENEPLGANGKQRAAEVAEVGAHKAELGAVRQEARLAEFLGIRAEGFFCSVSSINDSLPLTRKPFKMSV